MAKLIIENGHYLVDGRELELTMPIRRYDEVAGVWFEGVVSEMSSYDLEKQTRITGLTLYVEGYVPSPLIEGQNIEIVEGHNGRED